MRITLLNNVYMPALTKPAAVPPKTPAPNTKCLVTEQPDGALSVHFYVDEATASRIRKRANGMDLAKYMWENIIRAAVEGHVW